MSVLELWFVDGKAGDWSYDGRALTSRAVELLHGLSVDVADDATAGDIDDVDGGGVLDLEMPCAHPAVARLALHDDLPADDPDQIHVCAECGTEREGWAPC